MDTNEEACSSLRVGVPPPPVAEKTAVKTESDIMKRIANLYAQLESIREERRSSETPQEKGSASRVILVTRRLPREAGEDQGLSSSGTSAALQLEFGFKGGRRGPRIRDPMDQALANFRQIGTLGREVIWVGKPHEGPSHSGSSINFSATTANRERGGDSGIPQQQPQRNIESTSNVLHYESASSEKSPSISNMSSPGIRAQQVGCEVSSISSLTSITSAATLQLKTGLAASTSATAGTASSSGQQHQYQQPFRSQFVPVYLDEKRERQFYNGFCKRVLWPLFHSSPPTTRDVVARAKPPRVQGRYSPYADDQEEEDDALHNQNEAEDARQLWAAYVAANRAYADAVADVAREGDLIWIQDYHFMLVPQMLRSTLGEAKAAEAKLGFFLHVPFPSSELYRMLPYREEILRGLLAADLVGFQTYDYARHFLSSCEIVLGIETSPDRIEHDGHQTRICVCPVGIEPNVVRQRISNPAARGAFQRLESQLSGRTLVLSVDTLDPTKGLVHKFLALEELFDRHPDLADQMVFVQVALGGGGGGMASTREGEDDYSEFDDDENDDYIYGGELDHADGKRASTDTINTKNDTPGMPMDDDLDEDVLDSKSSGSVFERLATNVATAPVWSRGPLDVPAADTAKKWQGPIDPPASIASSTGASGRKTVDRLAKAHRRYYARAGASRSGGIFSTLERQLHSMVSRINSKLATIDFEGPVQYLSVTHPESEETMLAAMFALADVLVCTPIRDGMNVVPFEYLVARDEVGRVASVLLSEFAGCARSLGGASLINPWDTNRFATTLHNLIKRARAKQQLKLKNALRKSGSIKNAVVSDTITHPAVAVPPRNDDSVGGVVAATHHEPPLRSRSSSGSKTNSEILKVVSEGSRRGRSEKRHSSLEPPVSMLEGPRHRSSSGTRGKRGSLLTSNLDGGLDDDDDEEDDDELLDVTDEDDDEEEDAEQRSRIPASDGRSQRARGVERRRNHQHMLQYVSTFTAQSWAGRFLLQLQEASETKASRTLCREIKVPQLVSPYTKTKRRVVVLELEGALAKPCALPELLVVPEQTLEAIRSMCRDEANRMVVVMSARSARVLERVFAPILTSDPVPTNLVLAAEEGLAIKWRPKDAFFEMQVPPHDVDLSWHVDAAPLIEYYTERTPGSVVEVKESGLAWHYRDCDLNHGAWQARQLRVALGELAKHIPLSVFSGDKYIEVRPMRLSVPNVLEAALRRLNRADTGVADEQAPQMTPQPTSVPTAAVVESDDGLSEEDRRRGVDFVLYIASGNGLVDEEIFESMAPPPFDLDEFCYRVQKLSAGERLEDEDFSLSQPDIQHATSVVHGEPHSSDMEPPSGIPKVVASSFAVHMHSSKEEMDTKSQAESNSQKDIPVSPAAERGATEPALQGLEVATLGQFAAVMTGSEIDQRKKIPDPLREHLKRKAREPVHRLSKPSQSEVQVQMEEHSPNRLNYQPRRDFPPSAMLFQAMRRRYGRDWSRVDLPTTASACWALVGGRTPRPGAPMAERSTFLADFEDIRGTAAPDVEFPNEEIKHQEHDVNVDDKNSRQSSFRHVPRAVEEDSIAKSTVETALMSEPDETVRDSSFGEPISPGAVLPPLAPQRKGASKAAPVSPPVRNKGRGKSGAVMLTRALEMNALALSRAMKRDSVHSDDAVEPGAAAMKLRGRRRPASPSPAQFHWRDDEEHDEERLGSLPHRHHRSFPRLSKAEWQSENVDTDSLCASRDDSFDYSSGDASSLQAGVAASSYDDLSVTSTPTTSIDIRSSEAVQERLCRKQTLHDTTINTGAVDVNDESSREQRSRSAKFQTFEVYNAAPPLWGDVPIVDTSSSANTLVSGSGEKSQHEDYHITKRARGNDTTEASSVPQAAASKWLFLSGWSKSAATEKAAETMQEPVNAQLSRLRTRTMTPPPGGAPGKYLPIAARGAVTEQERREFDRAARVATSSRLRSGSGQEKGDTTEPDAVKSSHLPAGATNLSELLARPSRRYVSPHGKTKLEQDEKENAADMFSMLAPSDNFAEPRPIIEEVTDDGGVQKSEDKERETSSAASVSPDLGRGADVKRPTGSHSRPLSPSLGGAPPPPPMASLAAAAAAAANDDDYDGLDLPLQTFSCIVGIKLSQATYYLKSTDMVATLLQQFAQHSSSSKPPPAEL